jgi:hypothetical protein
MTSLGVELERIEIVLLLGLALFYVVLPLWAAREGIVWSFKRGTVAVLAYLIVHQLVIVKRMQPGVAVLLGLVGGYVAAQFVPARSRHIPARAKRKVIAEFEANTGQKYNSRKHELDHRWPHSRGGSNTADNLRVVSRTVNRRKGAKRPKPSDWF